MPTIGTLLSGGECVGVGAREAGLTHLWGFEIENDIAQVARDNGFNVTTADVMQLDPTALEVPDVLHVSTVCKRGSQANQTAELNEDGTKEAPEDIAMGEKVAQFIDVMTPKVFTLENVYAYRNFKAFKIICGALNRHGYMWGYDHLNAANFGVPQTRQRLILRAVRGALLPILPQPERWSSWYEAIEDLIPYLPESKFAAWQLKKFSLDTAFNFLTQNQNVQEWGKFYRSENEPAMTVVSSNSRPRIQAFLVAQGGFDGTIVTRSSDKPSFTITANNNQNNGVRSWLSQGHIVLMTPRALARFQSIPDSYILPENKALACKVIGNAVAPLLYQKIIQPLCLF